MSPSQSVRQSATSRSSTTSTVAEAATAAGPTVKGGGAGGEPEGEGGGLGRQRRLRGGQRAGAGARVGGAAGGLHGGGGLGDDLVGPDVDAGLQARVLVLPDELGDVRGVARRAQRRGDGGRQLRGVGALVGGLQARGA